MFSVGECVIYGGEDICRVADIGLPEVCARRGETGRYYILEPLFYQGVIYAPVDTRVPMRRVIGRDEALSLIESMPALESQSPRVSDRKRLAEYYEEMLSPGTCQAMARAAKSIYEKYVEEGERIKAPNSTEAAYYKRASEMLLSELSVALGESVQEVRRRIERSCAGGGEMRWSL